MTDDQPRGMRFGPRHRTEVTPAHVGQRVTIRHVLDEAGEQVTTDVVGHLRSWEDDQLRVERRDGSVAHVDASRIVASRVIPHPPPPRRRPRQP